MNPYLAILKAAEREAAKPPLGKNSDGKATDKLTKLTKAPDTPPFGSFVSASVPPSNRNIKMLGLAWLDLGPCFKCGQPSTIEFGDHTPLRGQVACRECGLPMIRRMTPTD